MHDHIFYLLKIGIIIGYGQLHQMLFQNLNMLHMLIYLFIVNFLE